MLLYNCIMIGGKVKISLLNYRILTKQALNNNDKFTIFYFALQFDMIHVTPPQGPIDAVKRSRLVDPAGFVDVDKHTMQHKKYENIFALGDCSNAPISKTAAAISGEGAAVRKNIMAVLEGKEPPLKVRFIIS